MFRDEWNNNSAVSQSICMGMPHLFLITDVPAWVEGGVSYCHAAGMPGNTATQYIFSGLHGSPWCPLHRRHATHQGQPSPWGQIQ
jgi:hypothetical protein